MSVNTNMQIIRRTRTRTRKHATDSIMLAVSIVSVVVVIAMLLNASITHTAFAQAQKTLRLGYFPNINHAQGVIGIGDGSFQKTLGDNVTLETFVFNAGPSAIESLLAGRLDASYIGPNPAINGYVVSDGQAVRVIAGATSAGASFVVRNDSGINSVQDLGGKKFASPQLGNTQDVALRKYLTDNGFNTVENGGNVTVLPIANADILTTFLKKEIAGAWVPEPWATRLVNEAGGKIFVDERDLWPPEGKFVTAHLIVSPKYLKENPDVIKRLLTAHVNETQWINEHKDEVPTVFNTELKKLTGQTIPEDVLTEALTRLEFTNDPIKLSLFQSANDAYDLGFLAKGQERPNLSGIYDLALLDQVLNEKGLPTIGDTGGQIVSSNNTGQSQGLTDVA
jgi:NitT/TauT family transport system substrate-binding protein